MLELSTLGELAHSQRETFNNKLGRSGNDSKVLGREIIARQVFNNISFGDKNVNEVRDYSSNSIVSHAGIAEKRKWKGV